MHNLHYALRLSFDNILRLQAMCILNFYVLKTIYWQLNWHFCQEQGKKLNLTSVDLFEVFNVFGNPFRPLSLKPHGHQVCSFAYVAINSS